MPTIQASSYNRPVYQGSHGNQSVAIAKYTFDATAVDTVVDIFSLPPGAQLTTALLYSSSGLGEGAGVDLLIGGAVVTSVDDFSAADTTHTRCVLEETTANTDVSVQVTGAAATGDLVLEIFYIYEGTL